MYGISNFTGDSAFWSKSHPLSEEYKELWDKHVPPSGEALTEHGELLRMMSRLVYDIFNNGLCNDKLEEIKYIQDSHPKYRSFLKMERSPIILQDLRLVQETPYDEEDPDLGIIADQEFCDRLDDITQAIVQYCELQDKQKSVILKSAFLQTPLHRKGVTKLIEELGELAQVLAKKDAFMDIDAHPDGKSLSLRAEEEIGDVLAAIEYCTNKLGLEANIISANAVWAATSDKEPTPQRSLDMFLFHLAYLLYLASKTCRGAKDFDLFNDQKTFQMQISKFIAWSNVYILQMNLSQNNIDARKAKKIELFNSWDNKLQSGSIND